MKNIKTVRRKAKIIFRISIILSIITMVVFSAIYTKNQHNWTLWAGCLAMVWLAFSIIVYACIKWIWDIKDLMTEFKEKDDLMSGGLAFVGVFGFVIILMFVLSKISYFANAKDLFETMSSLFAVAMPAFIGLLGVQYSVAIQERNRKQDLRLDAKPFFNIQCCKAIAIPDEIKHTIHEIKIKIKITNISQNIGIPIKVISRDSDNCEVVLPYTPLASKDVLEKEILVRSDELYGDNVHIAVVYKDTFENMYELTIEFIQSEKYELSNTQVLSDKLI